MTPGGPLTRRRAASRLSRGMPRRRELPQVLHGDDRRQRDLEAQIGDHLDAVERPLEGAGAADRIVRLRPAPVHRDLKLHELAGEAAQGRTARSAKERGVGQEDQLAPPLLGDASNQPVQIRPEKGLPARHVETLDAELAGLVDEPLELLRRKTGRFARPRIRQTVRAGEVAGVVRVQPQLAQARGARVMEATLVGGPFDRSQRQKPRSQSALQEVVHVEPRFPRFEPVSRGVAGEKVAEGPSPVELPEELAAPLVGRDPVGRVRIEEVLDPLFAERVEPRRVNNCLFR